MTAILLDTCAAIWLVEGVALSKQSREAVVAASVGDGLFVSPVTGWEVGTLCSAGRFLQAKTHSAAQRWMAALLTRAGIVVAPFTPAIALDSAHLPDLAHRDPADRFLISTARHLGIPLVTRDRAILRYAETGHVQCIPC